MMHRRTKLRQPPTKSGLLHVDCWCWLRSDRVDSCHGDAIKILLNEEKLQFFKVVNIDYKFLLKISSALSIHVCKAQRWCWIWKYQVPSPSVCVRQPEQACVTIPPTPCTTEEIQRLDIVLLKISRNYWENRKLRPKNICDHPEYHQLCSHPAEFYFEIKWHSLNIFHSHNLSTQLK